MNTVENVVEGGLNTVETVVEVGLNTVETVVVKGRRNGRIRRQSGPPDR